MRSVSIIIPAHNEERRIGKTLQAYSDFFELKRTRENLEYELLVVINNTRDKTKEVVISAQRKNSRISYLDYKQGGKGFAVLKGFETAIKGETELIGFVDADMATLPEDFYVLVKNLGRADAAIASRYMRGSTIHPRPTFQRLIAKRMFNTLVRSTLFLPIRDTQCGAKLFRKKAITSIFPRLSMSQWAFDVELLYHLRKSGFHIRELPTKWSDKEYSTINFWSAGPMMAFGVVRLRLLHSPLKRFIKIYDSFLELLR